MQEYGRNSRLVTHKYFRYFLPTILMVFSSSMSVLIDSIIVSNMLGPQYMTAVNACLPIAQLFVSIAALFGVGAATLIAHYKGQGKKTEVNRTFSWFWILSGFFGIILTLITVLFSNQMSSILTNASEIKESVSEYMKYMGYLALPMFLTSGISFIMQVDGRPTLASITVVSANVFNLVFDVILMGPCNMGIAGSSLATVIGYAIGLLSVVYYLLSKTRTIRFAKPVSFKTPLNICKFGVSTALSYLLFGVEVLCVNLIAGKAAGYVGVLAFGVCMSSVAFESIFIGGVSQTMTPIIGIFFGEKDFNGVKMVYKKAFLLLCILSISFVAFLVAFPELFFKLYNVTSSPELIKALRVFSFSLPLHGFNIFMLYYYNVVNKQKLSLFIILADGLFLILPLAYLFSLFWGIDGIWVAFILTDVIVALAIFFISAGRNKSIYRLVEEPSIMELSLEEVNIDDVVSKVLFELKYLNVEEKLANKIAIAIEEYYELLRNKNSKNIKADLVIKSFEEYYVLSVLDNGKIVDVMNENDSEEFSNAKMLKAISSKISYQRIIGLNRIEIVISK